MFSKNSHYAAILLAASCAVILSACSDMSDGWFGKKSAAVVAPEMAEPAKPAPLVKPTANSSIPVLVNDVPITEYDIGQRRRLDTLGSGGKPVSRDQVINELIDETIEAFEAMRQQIGVPDSQVDAAYANIAQHLKMSPAGLTKALASQGIDGISLKKRLRAQMVWQLLVQKRTLAKATVTNQEVKEAIQAKSGDQNVKTTEYSLQQIIFVVPKGASAGFVAQRRNEALAFRQRFAGCDQSINQAKLLHDVVVKDMGRRLSSELTGPDGDTVQKTKVGATTPPQQTRDGILLVAVCAERDIQGASQARADAENNLYLKQSADLGKDYLQELRDKAIIERR